MIIHLVAIILLNLAGFAWLVDIKYVFEKPNGLNSWVSDSVRTFRLFVCGRDGHIFRIGAHSYPLCHFIQ